MITAQDVVTERRAVYRIFGFLAIVLVKETVDGKLRRALGERLAQLIAAAASGDHALLHAMRMNLLTLVQEKRKSLLAQNRDGFREYVGILETALLLPAPPELSEKKPYFYATDLLLSLSGIYALGMLLIMPVGPAGDGFVRRTVAAAWQGDRTRESCRLPSELFKRIPEFAALANRTGRPEQEAMFTQLMEEARSRCGLLSLSP